MLILIYKILFLIMKTIEKSMLFFEEEINISNIKLIVISKELISNRYFINVANNF